MGFPFSQHLTVSWSLPVARIIFFKRCYACIKVLEKSQFSDSVALGTWYINFYIVIRDLFERIKSALQRKRSVIFRGKIRMIISLTSPATKLLSVRFHFVTNICAV